MAAVYRLQSVHFILMLLSRRGSNALSTPDSRTRPISCVMISANHAPCLRQERYLSYLSRVHRPPGPVINPLSPKHSCATIYEPVRCFRSYNSRTSSPLSPYDRPLVRNLYTLLFSLSLSLSLSLSVVSMSSCVSVSFSIFRNDRQCCPLVTFQIIVP
ncbi:hypothetical protein BKA70DRAFT_1296814 [Coprinopsis sp. MPI-PUGE-AT-0042]|nr:hypothetical protein BKA70DRAFT_1296814 [Coprinopsis sp. MPI-PUGE-AT-0042]